MSVMDFLFQGKTPPTQSSSSSSTSTLPAWYQTYLKGLIDRSNAIAGQPYTPYTGPRVAPFNANQQQSFDMTKGAMGTADPYMTESNSYLTKAGGGYNAADAKQWESPYLSNVTDAIARLGTRNLTENILPQIDSTFTGNSGWGGSRHGEFTERAMRDANESILNQQAETLQQGQQASMGNYLTSLGLTSTTGGQLGALGETAQRAKLTDAAALGAVGQQQQNQTQTSYDTAYQDFLNQINYPYQQAAFMQGIMQGFPVPQSTYTTNSAPGSNFQASPLASLVGGLGVGKSLFGNKGGEVPKFAFGGAVGDGYRGEGSHMLSPLQAMQPAASPLGVNPTAWAPNASPGTWGGRGPGRMNWTQGAGLRNLLSPRFAEGGPVMTPKLSTAIYGRRAPFMQVPRRGALSTLARPNIKPPFQGFKPMAASGPGPRRAFA